MWRIEWLNSAVDDVVRLREFIAKENQKAAAQAAKLIKTTSKRLLDHPKIGRPVEDMEGGYRDLYIPFGARNYVMRYALKNNIIYIISIRHGLESDC